MTPTPADRLGDRIRVALSPAAVREERMFGARCFMVEGALAVAAPKDGSLLVRVDPAEDDELLERPHVSRAQMGSGRAMGTGWLRIDPAAIARDDELGAWIVIALRRRSRA